MLDTLINYVDKFGPEITVILFGLLVILSTLFLWLWFSNRRKYHNLRHAIPANVVKNYLDSIIQNSTALKSSLFRGGSLEVGAVPSVMPLGQLIGGDGIAVSGAPSTALLEELNQKKAQLAALEAQLSALQSANRELESKAGSAGAGKNPVAEAKVKELEAQIASMQAGGTIAAAPQDDSLKNELAEVSRERDEIRDRLKEFEIIADDLANLKRLQQENEQLKRSLAAGGIAIPPSPVIEAKPKDDTPAAPQADVADLFEDMSSETPAGGEDTAALENFLNASEEISEPETAAAAPASSEEQDKPNNERTPEDLLSEFEKMLG